MNLPAETGVAVIGAGLAGSTLAATLAATLGERGIDVVLLERDRFPRNKVCGEFLSPEVVESLERLGAKEAFLAMGPASMTRTRITIAEGESLELPLPGEALGLSRKKLDHFLFRLAEERGALCFQGVEVKGIERLPSGKKRLLLNSQDLASWLEADLVICAYGRRTGLDRKLGRSFFEKRSSLMAYKRHFRALDGETVRELQGLVELHAFQGGYCGVSFVEEEILNVCTMFDAEKTVFDQRRGLEALREASGPLLRRLEGLTPVDDEELAIAQIPLLEKERSGGDVLFVGDAAGMIAPLAGDGQAMAIEGALALGELIRRRWPENPAEEWDGIWRRRYRTRVRLGRSLQYALTIPGLSRAAMGLVGRFPMAGAALIRWTR